MLSLYNNKLNGILADEMGLGKTVQVNCYSRTSLSEKITPVLDYVNACFNCNWLAYCSLKAVGGKYEARLLQCFDTTDSVLPSAGDGIDCLLDGVQRELWPTSNYSSQCCPGKLEGVYLLSYSQLHGLCLLLLIVLGVLAE